jgi:hypothetical protein
VLTFCQPIEVAVHRGSVEEELLPAIIADEPEALVAHDAFDGSAWHKCLRFENDRRSVEVAHPTATMSLQSMRPGVHG